MTIPFRLLASIDTAVRCSCGAAVTVTEFCAGSWQSWQASCGNCYDGTEDAAASEHCHGFGDTPSEALWAWAESHEEALEVAWEPVTLWSELEAKVAEESARQRGWGRSNAPDGAINYGPALAAAEGSEGHV